MEKMKKYLGYMLISMIACISTILSFVPQVAFAAGWSASDIISQSTNKAEFNNDALTFSSIEEFIQGATTFILAVAIIVFVLKVVLTAVNKLVFSKDAKGSSAEGDFDLSKIPIIGAYPINSNWRDIWLHCIKNVAVVLLSWTIVQLLIMVINFALGATGLNVAN